MFSDVNLARIFSDKSGKLLLICIILFFICFFTGTCCKSGEKYQETMYDKDHDKFNNAQITQNEETNYKKLYTSGP